MTLKCTVDGRQEARDHVIFACHHCGKPVCEGHGWVVSADPAFDDSAEDVGRRVPQPAMQSPRRVPQPAMHCKQCVDEHHPRAAKHAKWADPREAQRAAARAAQQQAGGQLEPQAGQPWGQPGQRPGQQRPQGPYSPPDYRPEQGQYRGQANGRP